MILPYLFNSNALLTNRVDDLDHVQLSRQLSSCLKLSSACVCVCAVCVTSYY